LLTTGGGAPAIHRYRVADQLTHEQTGPAASGDFLLAGLNVSADGKYVCLSSGIFNWNVPGPRPAWMLEDTKVYAVEELSKPALVLRSGAPLRGVAFDPQREKIYGSDGANLLVFDGKGEPVKKYPRPRESQSTVTCLLNPQGRQLLLTGYDCFSVVAWRP
jgi:hypothetical protein